MDLPGVEAAIAAIRARIAALGECERELVTAILAGGNCTASSCQHTSGGHCNVPSCGNYRGGCPEHMPPMRGG